MRFIRHTQAEERLTRLARKIEAAVRRDEERIRREQMIAGRRAEAAAQLHALCERFVDAVNGKLSQPRVELSPPDYSAASYRDDRPTLFQIAVSGRILQIEFGPTGTAMSTERLATPYILEGTVRAFNQDLLEMAVVREQPVFCCLEGEKLSWIWFDAQTRRSVPLDRERLVTLLERLL